MSPSERVPLTPPKEKNDKLRSFILTAQNKTKWRETPEQKTIIIDRLGTMDWSLMFASLLFISISSLFIANASCSRSQGVYGTAPVCVGGKLSIQGWLAIVGFEFGALGLWVVPRTRNLLISKFFTARLTSEGVSWTDVLNSQSTAPFRTQIRHGLKSTLFIRILVLVFVAIFSISSKFSFVQVKMFDTLGLPDASFSVALGCNADGKCNGISNNLIDALADVSYASGLENSSSPGTDSSVEGYTRVFWAKPG